MKRFPCVEATVDLELEEFVLRVWVDLGGVIPDDWHAEYKLVGEIERFIAEREPHVQRFALMEFVAGMPHVNAVQVIDRTLRKVKYGVVAYTVEFDGHQ